MSVQRRILTQSHIDSISLEWTYILCVGGGPPLESSSRFFSLIRASKTTLFDSTAKTGRLIYGPNAIAFYQNRRDKSRINSRLSSKMSENHHLMEFLLT